MSKRIKLVDWTLVLKLVLLLGTQSEDWAFITRYRIISRAIKSYIERELGESSIMLFHVSFSPYEPITYKRRVLIPLPSVLKAKKKVCIANINFPDEYVMDEIFISTITKNELLFDTLISGHTIEFQPIDNQAYSYMKIYVQCLGYDVAVYAHYVDLDSKNSKPRVSAGND